MSRQLNKKQKTKLREVYKAIREIWGGYPSGCDDIDSQTLQEIVDMNDHETVYQNISRYLWDLRTEELVRR